MWVVYPISTTLFCITEKTLEIYEKLLTSRAGGGILIKRSGNGTVKDAQNELVYLNKLNSKQKLMQISTRGGLLDAV